MAKRLTNAVRRGDVTEISKLLKSGVNINKKDDDGSTALMCTAFSGSAEVCRILLHEGAEPNSRDATDKTVLIWASINGHYELAKMLVSRGADVNLKDGEGMSALHHCANEGHPDIARILLENGTQKNVKDKKGRTPYTVARQRGKENIMMLLQSYGALVTKAPFDTVGDEHTSAAVFEAEAKALKASRESQDIKLQLHNVMREIETERVKSNEFTKRAELAQIVSLEERARASGYISRITELEQALETEKRESAVRLDDMESQVKYFKDEEKLALAELEVAHQKCAQLESELAAAKHSKSGNAVVVPSGHVAGSAGACACGASSGLGKLGAAGVGAVVGGASVVAMSNSKREDRRVAELEAQIERLHAQLVSEKKGHEEVEVERLNAQLVSERKTHLDEVAAEQARHKETLAVLAALRIAHAHKEQEAVSRTAALEEAVAHAEQLTSELVFEQASHRQTADALAALRASQSDSQKESEEKYQAQLANFEGMQNSFKEWMKTCPFTS